MEKIEAKERKSPKPSFEVKRKNSVHQLFRRRRRRRRRRSEQSLSFFSLCGKATSLIILHGIESDQWEREGEETEQKIRKVAAKARSMIRDEGRRPASNPASQQSKQGSRSEKEEEGGGKEEKEKNRETATTRPNRCTIISLSGIVEVHCPPIPDQHSAF